VGGFTPAAMVGQIGAAGTLAAAAMALAEYGLLVFLVRRAMATAGWLSPPDAGRSPVSWGILLGAGVALLAGAAAFPPAIVSVQVPLQGALTRWVSATLATADTYILSAPSVFMSGLVQEPAKFLAAAAGMALAGGLRPGVRRAEAVRRAVLYGAAAGVAFGGIEAAWVLSLGVLSGPGGWAAGLLSVAALERVFVVMFHMATAGLVVYAWSRSARKGLLALAAMVFLHSTMNYAIIPVTLGAIGAVAVEVWVAALSLGVFGALVFLGRRAGDPRRQAVE